MKLVKGFACNHRNLVECMLVRTFSTWDVLRVRIMFCFTVLLYMV